MAQTCHPTSSRGGLAQGSSGSARAASLLLNHCSCSDHQLSSETVKVTTTEWVREVPPEVPLPVTVMLKVPGVALLMVSVELPGTPTLVGLTEAETPAGAETVRATFPVHPLSAPSEMVEVAATPGAVVTELGEADIVKSGAACAVTVTVTAVL